MCRVHLSDGVGKCFGAEGAAAFGLADLFENVRHNFFALPREREFVCERECVMGQCACVCVRESVRERERERGRTREGGRERERERGREGETWREEERVRESIVRISCWLCAITCLP